MTTPLRTTVAFLGVYAGLIAVLHGVFTSMQGARAPSALVFTAIGAPCQAEAVWHACLPAMTLIPNLFISGLAAILIGISLAVAALFGAGRRLGWLVLAALSVVALLVGAGFVPVFIGVIAAVAASRLAAPAGPVGPVRRGVSALWPWPLVVMGFWFPASWLLGYFFAEGMLAASGILFIVFDLGMPVLAATSALARPERRQDL